MRLWFRQPCCPRFVPLTVGLLSFSVAPAWGQQTSAPKTVPNGTNSLRQQDQSKPSVQKSLLIGIPAEPSISTELASEEIDPVVMRAAMASMSHVSPVLWWLSGPTTHWNHPPNSPLSAEPPEEQSTRSMLVLGGSDDSNGSLMDDAQADLSEPEMIHDSQDVETIEVESPLVAQTDIDSTPAAERLTHKPVPRTVRTPFERTEESIPTVSGSRSAEEKSPAKGRTDLKSNSSLESQIAQETPDIDVAGPSNDGDQQGVDALRAIKPDTRRREIRIEDPSAELSVPAPIIQNKSLDPILNNRLQRADACLSFYLNNPESTAVRSPWAVMHALLAFGGDYELVHGQGRVNAIGWMCHNGTCRTQRMFTPQGRGFIPNVGGGVQGHEGQFLAILAQSNVPLDYPIQIGTSRFKVEDLVRYEMATCKEKSELTFKLIGLSYYLDSNKQWRANDGKVWSIPKLIQEELAQPIVGSACGGTHRLMGFSFSVRQRQLQGQPINGQYARASRFVHEYIDYTWQLQNPDGSFSTNWYEGRGNEPKDERKVQTSGHMMEWLLFTLGDEDIKQPRVAKGIDFLLSQIYDKRDHKWPIGPRGHATRAVALYKSRTLENLNKATEKAPSKSANSGAYATPSRK